VRKQRRKPVRKNAKTVRRRGARNEKNVNERRKNGDV
jgi:hypothetical protein